MNIDPILYLPEPEPHRDKLATDTPTNYPSSPITQAEDSSRSSTPSDPESPTGNDYSSRTTPRPTGQDDTQSAAALALLGLSMRTSSETPSTENQQSSSSPGPQKGATSMKVTLSSASDSSSTDSTGSTRMSNVSQKKRRSSESSGHTDERRAGNEKRTKWSEESGSPPTPKAKTDGWSDDMKRVYEQAAFALPPSGREQRRMFGDMRGRNEQLGLWVTLEIGTYCGRKRISSHSQTLKNHHGTNPELKRFLTTDISCNPTSPSDPYAWPLRLKQLVHRAYSSLPNHPVLPAVEDIDIATIALPAIPVRILRKDGVEVEMSLPDAIEYDKADQRSKNRDKKPVRGKPGKKSRTATPTHSRQDSSYYGNNGYGGGRSPDMPYSPGTGSYSTHGRSSSNNVHRDVDRQTRYRQYSHTNADLPPHHHHHSGYDDRHHGQSGGSGGGSSGFRPSSHSSTTPMYWDRKHQSSSHGYSGRDRDREREREYRERENQPDFHPPQMPHQHEHESYPAPRSGGLTRQHYNAGRYEDGPSDEEDEEGTPPPRQPHPPSLDFLISKPASAPRPTPPRTFWKSG